MQSGRRSCGEGGRYSSFGGDGTVVAFAYLVKILGFIRLKPSEFQNVKKVWLRVSRISRKANLSQIVITSNYVVVACEGTNIYNCRSSSDHRYIHGRSLDGSQFTGLESEIIRNLEAFYFPTFTPLRVRNFTENWTPNGNTKWRINNHAIDLAKNIRLTLLGFRRFRCPPFCFLFFPSFPHQLTACSLLKIIQMDANITSYSLF